MALVRVRKHQELVDRIDETGTQVDVASAAGLSIQRLNQLYTGSHSVVEVRKARALEDALGVPHGTYFEAVDGPLLVPYVHDEDPDDDREACAGDGIDEPPPARDADPPAMPPPSAPIVSASAA